MVSGYRMWNDWLHVGTHCRVQSEHTFLNDDLLRHADADLLLVLVNAFCTIPDIAVACLLFPLSSPIQRCLQCFAGVGCCQGPEKAGIYTRRRLTLSMIPSETGLSMLVRFASCMTDS